MLYTVQGWHWRAQFGHSVAAAGDVDGDGLDDVIVGAPFDHKGVIANKHGLHQSRSAHEHASIAESIVACSEAVALADAPDHEPVKRLALTGAKSLTVQERRDLAVRVVIEQAVDLFDHVLRRLPQLPGV